MKKYLIAGALITVSLYSCKESKEDRISKRWQAYDLSSPQMENMVKDQQLFIDTFGKGADKEAAIRNYGVANLDSVRQALQNELNDFKAMQHHAVSNTWFDLRKNGVAVMNFSGQVDSSSWYFNDEGSLVLDEMKLKGTGSKIIMEIVSLEDTLLKLRYNEDGVTSTVTFRPEK